MKNTEKKGSRKALIVTDKQLDVIKSSCELYGRIQLGQFGEFAEIVTQTGFSGWELRVQPKKNKGESADQYKARCDALEEKDRIICDCIDGMLDGLYRHAYHYEGKPRTNEANISLDIWGLLDGRREDGFHMGSEPLVQVKDYEENEK